MCIWSCSVADISFGFLLGNLDFLILAKISYVTRSTCEWERFGSSDPCFHVTGLDTEAWSKQASLPVQSLPPPGRVVQTASGMSQQSLTQAARVWRWPFGVFWRSGIHVQCLSVFICTEAQQWESLPAESREQLIRSLSTMASDSRPELQEKAFLLKKTLENLD